MNEEIKSFWFTSDNSENGSYAFSTIVVNGDLLGSVIIFSSDEKITESDQKISQIASLFLAKYLEE